MILTETTMLSVESAVNKKKNKRCVKSGVYILKYSDDSIKIGMS